jgi:hypothetical protein
VTAAGLPPSAGAAVRVSVGAEEIGALGQALLDGLG